MAATCPHCKILLTDEQVPRKGMLCPRCGEELVTSWDDSKAVGHFEIDEQDLKTTAQPDETLLVSRISEAIQKLGNYEILEKVARGATGVVYKARHLGLRRLVALKVLLGGTHSSYEDIHRFYKEAEAIARLNHPHIVPVYDIGTFGEHHYFAMGYVEGQSLDEMLASGRPTVAMALSIVLQVASAIGYAHSRGIIHRDLKPANVLVMRDGRVQVTDFGLAQDRQSRVKLTETGQILGTPSYMPPEQARGQVREIDERSDVYSLGAILYELLTSRPPFDGETNWDIILKATSEDPLPPRRINPEVPLDVQTICLKAMDKVKEYRYPSMQAFAEDIERYLSGDDIRARPSTIVTRTVRVARRNKVASGAVALSIATLLVTGGIILELQRRTLHAENAILRQQEAEIRPWTLAFEDDRPDPKSLGVEYLPISGQWKASGGELIGSGDAELAILLARRFAGNVRLTFEASLAQAPGRQVADLSALLCCTREKHAYDGYCLQFGASENTSTRICRGEVVGAKSCSLRVEPNRVYRIRCEREDNWVRLYIDDMAHPVLAYEDLFPLEDDRHQYVGFYGWNAEMHIRRIRVQGQSPPLKVPAMALPDNYFRDGHYREAAARYEALARGRGDTEEAFQARYKIALCRMQLEEWDAARATLDDLLSAHPEDRLAPHCLLQRIRVSLVSREGNALALLNELLRRPDWASVRDPIASLLHEVFAMGGCEIPYGEAIPFLKRAATLTPEDTWYTLASLDRLATLYRYDNDFQASLDVGVQMEKKADSDRHRRRGLELQAQALMLMGRVDEARRIHAHLADECRNNATLLSAYVQNAADLLSNLAGRHDEAEAFLKEWRPRIAESERFALDLLRAKIALRQQKNDAAEQILDALERMPEAPAKAPARSASQRRELDSLHAWLCMNRDQSDEARLCQARACDFTPTAGPLDPAAVAEMAKRGPLPSPAGTLALACLEMDAKNTAGARALLELVAAERLRIYRLSALLLLGRMTPEEFETQARRYGNGASFQWALAEFRYQSGDVASARKIFAELAKRPGGILPLAAYRLRQIDKVGQ